MTEIPFTTEPRADSGLTSPALGLWLFLASEVMMFASLFSAYALLRLGAEQWPSGPERLHSAVGGLSTLILLASSVALIAAARRRLSSAGERREVRGLVGVAVLLAATFVVIKLLEYRGVVLAGFVPSSDVYSALYFTLTGIHLLHLIGGMAVALHFLASDLDDRPAVSRQRIRLLGWYWHFVAGIWILLFCLLYLT